MKRHHITYDNSVFYNLLKELNVLSKKKSKGKKKGDRFLTSEEFNVRRTNRDEWSNVFKLDLINRIGGN